MRMFTGTFKLSSQLEIHFKLSEMFHLTYFLGSTIVF
jgi:hypothetical protein